MRAVACLTFAWLLSTALAEHELSASEVPLAVRRTNADASESGSANNGLRDLEAKSEKSEEVEHGDPKREAGAEEEESGEEGKDGEAAEAAEEADQVVEMMNLTVGIMLVGSIAVFLGLFYLLNHPDGDIQMTAWRTICQTLSIFVAVLVFHGMCALTEAAADELLEQCGIKKTQAHTAAVDAIQILFWFILLHSSIAFIAYEHHDSAFDHKLRITCWASFNAHATAFACINGFGRYQHLGFFAESPAASVLPIVMLVLLLKLLFRISDAVRSFGKWPEHVLEIWDEVSEETENDVAFISISFLLVQSLRYGFVGEMPDMEGILEAEVENPWGLMLQLLGMAVLFAVITMGMYFLIASRVLATDSNACVASEELYAHKNSVEFATCSVYLWRWFKNIHFITSTASAWCLMFSVQAVFLVVPAPNGKHFRKTSSIQSLCFAMAMSGLCFSLVFILDVIHDKMHVLSVIRVVIKCYVRSLAILIGFTWEEAFAFGLDSIAEITAPYGEWYPILTKFALGILVAVIVVPAYRLYILKRMMELEETHRKDVEFQLEKASMSYRDFQLIEDPHSCNMTTMTPAMTPTGPTPRP
eukprot:TRINITY_DN32353_c0_g1_i1.p1 TRINITY_DN32353_c0_g1~~TRINITY_DN32353_c0_g1_i1.p1  ORF type:complete len:632 (+),score=81.10 TRINITY_DN32353_c0_g1_i1:133-1896(+)